MTSTTLFSLPTQYLMLQCFVPHLSDSFFYFPNCNKKGKRYNKIKPLGHSEMWSERLTLAGMQILLQIETHLHACAHREHKQRTAVWLY